MVRGGMDAAGEEELGATDARAWAGKRNIDG